MSADTIVPGYANPQALNRYSYVLNNPLRYTDPTGHRVDEGCGTGGAGCNLPTTPSLNINYCATHPWSCGNNHNTQTPTSTPTTTPTTTSTPAATMTVTVTPSCTNPSNLCTTITAGQATYVAGQPTMLAWQCQHYPCYGNVTATSTPTATPIPYNDNKFPVKSFVPSALSWPPDFSPNADDIWNIVGNALPLINQPVVNSNTIVNSIVDGATNAINTASNTLLGYAGYLVSNGISPTIPILPYAPSTNPLAPVYQ